MNLFPIGIHAGLTGYSPKPYTEAINDAGHAAFIKVVDDTGRANEALRVGRERGIENVVVFRSTAAGDLPDYQLEPEVAAARHFERHREHIQYLDDGCWVETINEPDRNIMNWLGAYAYEMALLLLAHFPTLRYCAPSSNSGEPETAADWMSDGWRRFFELAESNPGRLGVSVHQYNWAAKPFDEVYPWHVGREEQVRIACEHFDVPVPPILVTEWGFAHDHVPLWPVIEQYTKDCIEYYGERGMAGALWCYQNYQGNVSHEAHAIEQNLISLARSWVPPSPNPDPDPDPDPEPGGAKYAIQPFASPVTDEKYVYYVKVPMGEGEQWGEPRRTNGTGGAFEQEVFEKGMELAVVSYNEEAAVQKKAAADGLYLMGSEKWVTIEAEPNGDQEEPSLGEIVLGPMFHAPHGITSRLNDPRDYDDDGVFDDLHEGVDLDIFGGGLNSLEPVRCAYNGRVQRVVSSLGSEYGMYVIVSHVAPNGVRFRTWYAHLDDVYVTEGAAVERGDPVGELGDTGGDWAEHVHFNVQVVGYDTGNRYVVNGVIDPEPYITTDVPQSGMDLLPYFKPAQQFGPVFELQTQGAGQERVQAQSHGHNAFYHVKNREWEQLFYDSQYIYRGIDTSQGPNRFYLLEDDGLSNRSRWIPRNMRVGSRYLRSPIVHNYQYNDAGCWLLNSGRATSWIVFAEHYDSLTFFTGTRLNDVIVLEWYFDLSANFVERYYYARGYGLVGWESEDGRKAAVNEIHDPGSRPNNERRVLPCSIGD